MGPSAMSGYLSKWVLRLERFPMTDLCGFPLGRTTDARLRNLEITHVPMTHTTPATVRQTILLSHQRLGIRRGSRTLTGGRTQPTHQ